MNVYDRSAVAIFCDDVREEKRGKKTIVGVYSFEVDVDNFPYTFPRLCVYSQFVYSTDKPIERFSLKLYSDGELLMDHPAPEAFIKSSREMSIAQGRPTTALFTAIEMISVEVSEPSVMIAVMEVDGEEYHAGRLAVSGSQKGRSVDSE